MKNKLFLLAFLSILIFASCGQDEVSTKTDNAAESIFRIKSGNAIKSPDGFVIADSEEELKTTLFQKNDPRTTIGNIQFYRLNRSDAAVAIIDYIDNGTRKNIALTMGNIYVGFSSSAKQLFTLTSKRGTATTYNCGGQGCCYVGGTLDPDTGVPTSFTCKCEGNPNGNSGCSLTVNSNNLTLAPNHQ